MSTTNFTYTGSAQSYVVPANCSVIVVDMCGGAADRYSFNQQIGYGTRVQFRQAVTAASTLTVYVGQDGTLYNGTPSTFQGVGRAGHSGGGGGGYFSTAAGNSAAGGGSSAIVSSGTLLAEAGGGCFSYTTGAGGGGGYAGGSGQAGGGTQDGGGGGGGNGGNGGAGGGSGGAGGTGAGGGTAGTAGSGTTGGAGGGSGGIPGTGGAGASYVASGAGIVTTNQYGTGYVNITNPAPAAPALTTPPTGTAESNPTVFDWSYTPTLSGNAMTGFVLRYKLVNAAAWSYYNAAAPSTPSSTPVVNSQAYPGVTFPGTIFTNGNSYQWNVANVDQGGQGPWAATDATLIAQANPTITLTNPTGGIMTQANGGYAFTLTPGGSASVYAYQVQTYLGTTLVDDSGELPTYGGTSFTYDTATYLNNGSTYTVTITAFQSGGALPQAFSQSTSLLTQFDPPGAPTVTATATTDSNGTPCVAITVQGHDNLLSGVDSSGETTGWSWASSHGLSQSTTHALDGLYSLKGVLPSGTTSETYTTAVVMPVNPGDYYEAMVSAYGGAAGGTLFCGLAFYSDAGGTVLIGATDHYGTGVTISGSAWVRALTGGIQAPNNAVCCRGIFQTSGLASGGSTTYFDEMGIFPVGASPGTYTTWTIGGFVTNDYWLISRTDQSGNGNGDGYVRGWSASDDTPAPTPSQRQTIYDYEAVQGVTYQYTVEVIGVATVPASNQANSGNVKVQTYNWIILDPLNPTTLYAVVQALSFSPSRGEYSAPHKQIGSDYLNVVTDTVGGQDGSITVRVTDAGTWNRLMGSAQAGGATSLSTCQRTVLISDPYGANYYARLGIAPGGTASGTANPTAAAALTQVSIAQPVRDVTLQFIAQPPPTP